VYGVIGLIMEIIRGVEIPDIKEWSLVQRVWDKG
jgi:hypothetical protein